MCVLCPWLSDGCKAPATILTDAHDKEKAMRNLKDYGGWALVTGASSGIGREFARAIASCGMDCILVARRADRLEELRYELESQHGVTCRSVACDLAAAGAVEKLVQQIGDTPIGLLVNNAGFGHSGEFADRDPRRLDDMVLLNCLTPVKLTRAFLPAMVERGKGGIVMVASLLAFVPCPYDAVYGATKAFDLSLGEALWAELRGSGVDVVTLCPGPTKTEFFEVDGLKRAQAKRMEAFASTPEAMARLALGRLGAKPTTAPFLSWLTSFSTRFAPRRLVALVSAAVTRRAYLH